MLTGHCGVYSPSICKEGNLGKLCSKFWIVQSLLPEPPGAFGRAKQGVEVEIAKCDLGVGWLVVNGGVYVGEHRLVAGEYMVQQIILQV